MSVNEARKRVGGAPHDGRPPPPPYTAQQQLLIKQRQAAAAAGIDNNDSNIDEIIDDFKYSKCNNTRIILILLLLISIICLIFSISYYYTSSLTFGYYNYYRNKKLWLTPEELSVYDGSDPNKPIYLSVKGNIIDVTSGGESYYGRDAGYNIFAGRDATRAFITGCFRSGLTHDLRGLTDKQIEQIDSWTKFYLDHQTYKHIGYLKLPPIDKNSPMPNDTCPHG